MGKNVFSVPIFFIVFRETLEAAIIVSVLLGLVEQIVHNDPALLPGAVPPTPSEKERERPPLEKSDSSNNSNEGAVAAPELPSGEDLQVDTKRLLRKMRIYIFAGALLGLFVALAIGAAFIAVWFTQAADLWSKSEELWEGMCLYRCITVYNPKPLAHHRYLLACRVSHYLRHGCQYAQDGQSEGEVAGEAPASLCWQRLVPMPSVIATMVLTSRTPQLRVEAQRPASTFCSSCHSSLCFVKVSSAVIVIVSEMG